MEDKNQNDLLKPPVKRSMEVLDKHFFKKSVLLSAAIVPLSLIASFRKICSADVLKNNISIVPMDSLFKKVLLKPRISPYDLSKLTKRSSEFIKEHKISIIPYVLELNYDFWNSDDILSAILPENLLESIPCSFAQVGHIAHMNIREEYLPYKKIIGEVILSKNKGIRTVVNKVDIIDTTFRNFKMEVLAGENDFFVEHSESNCRFKFDFSKVYWNSRLNDERHRLIQLFQKGDAICDVFAGVGPFSIPAGKKRVIVFSNDLNPDSYKSMKENISLNKVDLFVKAYCKDGRQFIRDSVHELIEFSKQKTINVPNGKKTKSQESFPKFENILIPQVFKHFIMNLPETSIDFLDAFKGIYSGYKHLFLSTKNSLPTIHVYCFSKLSPPDDLIPVRCYCLHKKILIFQRLSTSLGINLLKNNVNIHYVRKVSPNKSMYCCSFKFPEEIAFKSI
ncbi:tRNA (guanine) methyltransferase [Pneumocystis jirovecii RU7]|uniref:tRNA (guanine(37)-N1)-methyltransferase n=1 Tax=Pneumocystis jirovecii (strain RU7) TaxID=1408657 RepID=A0A0W4ZRB0_PNEJ7|nr:tRNA (guanine) methyltransferase [Pneumocystis jirovecii RU7]KTW30899.1 hypothetical protein T551_01451 [Pneumocystis jirovecii RU7]